MKHKITVSIDSEILKHIDSVVGTKFRSRSHAFEELLKKGMNSKTLDTAIILAGGLGTRLRPITYEIPKALVPIKNKPVLKWQIDMLRKNNIKNIYVSIGHMSEKIRHAMNKEKILFIQEEKPLGTGGAVNLAKKYLHEENFVVLNSDALFSNYPALPEMFKFHLKEKCTATLLLMPTKNFMQGVVKLSGNKIIEFCEKPKETKFGLISAGLYIFNKEIFDYLKPICSLENDIFPILAKKRKLAGYVIEGEIFDVGTHKGYENTIKHWKGY